MSRQLEVRRHHAYVIPDRARGVAEHQPTRHPLTTATPVAAARRPDTLRIALAGLVCIVALGAVAFLSVVGARDGVAVVAAGWSFVIGAVMAFFATVLLVDRMCSR